jgi:hypothetical protein
LYIACFTLRADEGEDWPMKPSHTSGTLEDFDNLEKSGIPGDISQVLKCLQVTDHWGMRYVAETPLRAWSVALKGNGRAGHIKENTDGGEVRP